MVEPITLVTQRLQLRPWRESDRDPFAMLNADPRVMEHFPSTLDRERSDALVDRIEAEFAEQGWGLWAVEVVDGAEFCGFIGMAAAEHALGRPAIEVGWRLAHEHWGHGYAPEGGLACLRFAFDDLGLDEIVSFTVPANVNSRRVMEKIGLHLVGDIEHQGLPPDSPHRHHVLYALTVEEWRTGPRWPGRITPR
ncbi:MAG TPA: GNAT family N-acetyltransferase [Intrasporangium sp.]|uniref:GNAT family N-acetyltransferase n=1 Tax=Intrasporangium sp. TaxID=1925024 RepID=UPI002B46EEBF|nr:GNAT family N-acetyltransferase [Intrasporangium sp.]HKX68158.1 GNAT family N-acetyltransferase [Intrasporangium sp.]